MKPIKPKAAGWLAAAAVMAAGLPAQAQAKESPALALARQLNEAFVEVADQVSPAVVVIDIRQKVNAKDAKDGEDGGSFWDLLPPEVRRHFPNHGNTHEQVLEGEGSGVIISPDGYILTNNHVVEDADEITVRLKDGRTFTGTVQGVDPASDIAVVKIKATGLTTAKLGNSDATRVGEFVLAIGAPFELNDTVTVGHVSAKGRSFEQDADQYADQDFLQTDAKILPGNSGGPLVNLYGEVIGINTMIEGLDTGIGFAVPINLAKRVKDHLISEGKFTRSWLGIQILELKDDRDYLGLDGKLAPDAHDGILVTGILTDGPASKSDLKPGDVITAVDGKTVQTTRQLRDEVAGKKPGRTTVLAVVRGKDHLTVKVAPAAMPAKEEVAVREHHPRDEVESGLGLSVQGLTRELAQQLGVDFASGVIITAVEQGSTADLHGIKAGDIITEINRKGITTPRQFHDAVKSADPKRGMMLNLLSDGTSRFVVLKDSGGMEK